MNSPFSNTATEHDLVELRPSSGAVPEDLRGAYIKNGPGDFKVNCEPMEHWFDGFAMLRAFYFDSGRVRYQAKYLQTRGYTETRRRGRLRFPMFAATPKFRWWEYLREVIKGRQSGHNANISVEEIAGRYFALTESKGMTEFDPATLEVIEQFEFDDKVNQKSKSTTAHPIPDQARGELVNFETVPGPMFWHHYFKVDTSTLERQMIGKVGGRFPSYIHSFGMSGRYIIHIDFPLVAFPVSLLLRFGFLSYAGLFKWKPEFGTRISLINRATGEVDHTFEAEPFFAFHTANAWDDGDEVVFDICAWPSSKIIANLTLDALQTSDARTVEEQALLTRYRLDLVSGEVSHEVLSEKHLETPVFNEEFRFRPYRFCYGVGSDGDRFDNSIVKIDLAGGAVREWSEDGVYAGEPVFLPSAGDGAAEDDGRLLSIVVSPEEDASFLLVLSAVDLSEICRIPIPGYTVPSVHGSFFPDGVPRS